MLVHKSRLIRLSRWLASHVVQDVPADLEVCEFDCREPACPREGCAACTRQREGSTDGVTHLKAKRSIWFVRR